MIKDKYFQASSKTSNHMLDSTEGILAISIHIIPSNGTLHFIHMNWG